MNRRPKEFAKPNAVEIFRERAGRFQSECGWCGRAVGDAPVFAVNAKPLPGIDLSKVRGKAIEIALESAGKTVLAAVTGLDSDMKKAGHDFIFMVCSEACGGHLRAAVASDLARQG